MKSFKMSKNFYQLFILIISATFASAQQTMFELGQWKHESLNGSVLLQGLYRSQETILPSGVTEKPVTQNFSGQLKLNSRSFIWHPNFWKLDINLDYNPLVQNERFLVIPNRSETRTAEQLRIQSVFFNERPLSVNMFVNLNHQFINREFTSNVEGYTTDYGGGFSFRNAVLPITANYLSSSGEQKELATGRNFINKRENVRTELNKSFGKYDVNRFTFTYDDFSREYGAANKVQNQVKGWRLQNSYQFDKSRKSNWRSLVFLRQQSGSQEFDRLQINENIIYAMPAGFKASANYRYAGFDQTRLNTRQHNILGRLEHQLFLSLTSRAFYEYIDLDHSAYNEFTNQGGVSFDYKKNIPTGQLNLAYEYRRRSDNRNSNPAVLRIVNEEHDLTDGQVILLKNPDIDPNSVIIRDESGTIIFQENFDYVLIERGAFLEIQRLPGGQIIDGQTIFAEYSAQRSQSYNFTTNSNIFRIGFNLFDRLFESYFRYYEQNYGDVIKADNKILKTIHQRVYGVRLSKGFVTGGAEFENYDSNIVPYQSQRYFIKMTRNFSSKFNASLTSNWRNYELIEENEKQKFADISARLIYFVGIYSRLSFDGGYRFQEGRGIDLNLSNLRIEFSTRFRSIYATVGLEFYRRDFSSEKINYSGAYIRIERKF